MNFTRMTSIRNLARKLGLTRLLSIRSTIANNKARKYYETHKPASAEISILGCAYKLHTNSAYEWMRANAVYQDKHILTQLFNNLKPGMDCWDIGASIGAYSCFLSYKNKPGGVVYAFEPEKESRQKLEANISLNNIANIHVYDLALGSAEKELQLVLAHDATAGTHRLDQHAGVASGGSQTVKVTTIDSLINRDNLKIPGVMKIDVEGFEEQVLLGGLHTIANVHCQAIMIEMHFSIYATEGDNTRAGRIETLLQTAGFKNLTWVDASHLLATK